ncbi:helix-turn-helix domain-containing protein [Frankia sp. BMG5.23]|uniref:helix-turn-helix domain-containing protein n=1 Tax=Frankia sp. BMG5.23 TaxID=683305 RepID=UPI000461A321|nr:helix-turn-helix domain-containing protein [Frankia sp. BMG5.23]KDA44872.1 hypothetical protein BMG523Draft_00396 [Frankia sp. BMG5.23]
MSHHARGSLPEGGQDPHHGSPSPRWRVERAIVASDLSATARLILLTLLVVVDFQTLTTPQEFTPSLSGLARMTGLGRSTVARELERLERAGWVIRDRPSPADARSKKHRTCYRVAVPAGLPVGPVDPFAGPSVGPADPPPGPGAGPELVPERDGGSPAAGHNQHFPELPEQAAAAEPDHDEPEPPPPVDERPAAEHPADSTEANPYADLAGSLVADERLPASWRQDVASALARGCAPGQIVDAYRAPLSGSVRSPAAVRRRRILDLQPTPANPKPAVKPTPPNLRTMCRLHTQPAPCPVCADLAADSSASGGPRAVTAAARTCTRSPAAVEALAELRARLPRGRR